MQFIAITSHDNALVKEARKLHDRSYREKCGLFLLEGAKLLNEAFMKNVKLKAIFASESFVEDGLPDLDQERCNINAIHVVDDKMLVEMGTMTTPCGVIAIGHSKVTSLEKALGGSNPLIVIGDQLQDPGNLGTLIRSSLAFGATSLVLTKGSVDPYNPKVVRSAMGALFSLPIAADIPEEDLVQGLKSKKVPLIAFAGNASKTVFDIDFHGPYALAFGNEGHGLSDILIKEAKEVISIPIADATESLNVSIAAGVVLFRAMEIRRKTKGE